VLDFRRDKVTVDSISIPQYSEHCRHLRINNQRDDNAILLPSLTTPPTHSFSLALQDAVAEGFLSHGDLGAGQRADSLPEEVQELED
jgi:hypothetical protein